MTELLFGVEKLNGQSKPVQCVLSYHEKFLEILKEINSSDAQQKNGTSSTGNNSMLKITIFYSFVYRNEKVTTH